MKKPDLRLLLISPLLAILGACQPGATMVERKSIPPVIPIASIQEVMHALVDPSSDALWASVSTTITKDGVEEKQPHTDEEWNAVRLHALKVIAGAGLLQLEGIKVVREGVKIVDTHETYLNEAGIAQVIAKDPAAFAAAANVMQVSGQEILAAIEARDVKQLVVASGHLNESSCEGCHLKYWYPNQILPRWKVTPIAVK